MAELQPSAADLKKAIAAVDVVDFNAQVLMGTVSLVRRERDKAEHVGQTRVFDIVGELRQYLGEGLGRSHFLVFRFFEVSVSGHGRFLYGAVKLRFLRMPDGTLREEVSHGT